ncbi:MAG: hypothetical protein OCD00_01335 [Colwellia sp.]
MSINSIHKLQKAILLILMSGIALFAQAQEQEQVAPFSLKSLKFDQASEQVKTNGLATVTMIYQPDCSWCKKQGKALAKAFEHCQRSINITLVGTKGSARQLKKELKHYHKDIPAFIADRNFLHLIGGYQASPTILIFNKQGQLITKKRGFIPHDKLSKALNILSQGDCNI